MTVSCYEWFEYKELECPIMTLCINKEAGQVSIQKKETFCRNCLFFKNEDNCGHIFCGVCHNNKIKIEHLEYGLGKMARCCPKCISTDIVPPQEETQ